MELAKPPDDPEQKNIIDKLANFVARNGPEFEHLTKQKQKDNPRFSFLFGGENYNYYQYRVTTEQAILKKQQQQQQVATSQHGMLGHTMPSNTPWQQNPPPTNIPPPGMALPSVPPPQLAVPQPTPATLPVTTSGPPTTPAPNTQDTQQKLQQHVQQQVQLEAQIKQKQESLQQLKEQLVVQQAQAADQITQSNSNLAAQYQSLRQQQEILIQQAISDMKETQLDKMAQDCGVSVDEIDNIVKPIIEACTKDAISTGKNWIFSHNQSEKHGQMITRYLLHRVTAKEATFELRLHLIYLINDVLHHCKRKNLDETLAQFGRVVVPIFCTTHVAADDDQRAKLTKLLNLWKQNGYFNDAVEKMADPGLALSNYQAMEREEFNELAKNISRDIQTRYGGLQKQHNDFVAHVQAQLTQLQTAVSSAEAELKPLEAQLPSLKATITNLSAQLLPAPPQQPPVSTPTSQPTASSPMQQGAPPSVPPFPPPHFQGPPPNFNAPPPGFPPGVPPGLPPPGMSGPGGPITMPGPNGAIPLPDLSRPPPGFMGLPPTGPPPLPQITEADLMPSVPYYELPAGLLAPLVKLEDSDYKPLRPKDIRLPPPMPPSERLLAAVEAFYSPPSHDRPRDAEGWEKLGLYEFFKAKQKAKKLREIEDRNRKDREREEDKKEREREKEMDDEGKKNETKRRRYQEVQQPRPRRSRSRSRSRSGSPLPYLRSSRSRSRSKSRSKSRSPRRSVTPPPRRRSKSRSPTPPSFFNEPFYQTNTDSRLGEENKGHQLMRKMGWGGGGLGSSEQGRVDPIEAAEVRDRTDMYKGIGTSMTDPFEQFRKSKSQGYTNRMRAITEKAASTKN